MKILIIVLVSICISEALLSKSLLAEKWNTFKKSHKRQFSNSSEEEFRKTIFNLKLQHIEEHNERYRKGLESYTIGVNQFTDYTDEEMMPYTHGLQLPLQQSPESLTNIASNYSSGFISTLSVVPSSVDWRSQGAVTPVKNQGSCGSCWAFATLGALESHLKIYIGWTIPLSEQQLVDCLPPPHYGCTGGYPRESYMYIIENGGINNDIDYPYEAKQGTCRYQASKPRAVISSYGYLPEKGNEEMLKEIVATKGPVAVHIDVSGNFGSYTGGVYYNPTCSTTALGHAVVIVGYGSENGEDYWLVKNSWGPFWGDNGFIKMARNRGNHCGIASYVCYPIF